MQILENAKVTGIERLNSSGGLLLTSTAGEIEAQKVILTPGPWASKILSALDPDLGLSFRTQAQNSHTHHITVLIYHNFGVRMAFAADLPLRPTHTTLAYWRMEDQAGQGLIDWRKLPVFIDYTTHVYGTPSLEYPGLVKIGYHDGHEVDPDDRDFSPSEKVIKVGAALALL